MLQHRRGLSLLIATSYMLLVTTAVLFHNHGDSPCTSAHCGGPAAQAAGHGPADAAHHSHRDDSSPARQPCSSDDHCPVCQFLAQRTIPAGSVALVMSAPLEQTVVVVVPVRIAHRVPFGWHSRAPPVIA
jgi:hypothetical protein